MVDRDYGPPPTRKSLPELRIVEVIEADDMSTANRILANGNWVLLAVGIDHNGLPRYIFGMPKD